MRDSDGLLGDAGVLRAGQLFRLGTVLESGGQDGSFTFQRYQEWLEAKTDWAQPEVERVEVAESPPLPVPPVERSTPRPLPPRQSGDGVLEIEDAEDPADVLAQLNRTGGRSR